MKREPITRRSEALGKDMGLIVYGEGGYPVIAFQAQGSKCDDFESFGMVEALADYLEDGTIQLFSVDNNDEESWSATDADKAWRADRQEAYFRFVTDELVPLVHELNGTERRPLAIGCSMGATHAALAALRRPDLFQGCIALSGVYDARYFFGDWMNEVLYENSVTSFLPNLPADHPYVELYGQRQLVLCVGQGAWEDQGVADLRVIADACHDKGIDAWCDFWGYDVDHDWPWWQRQIRYFLPIVLEDMDKTLANEDAARKPAAKARRTARKAAAGAKAATKRATSSARKVAAKVATDAKATTGRAKADAKRAATDVEDAAERAAADAKRATGRAKAAARKAEAKVEANTRRAAAEVKTDASKATSVAKKAVANVEATTEKVAEKAVATTKRGVTRAKTTAKRTEAAVEKAADEAKETVAKAAATTRGKAAKAAASTRAAAKKATDGVEEAAAKVADEAKATTKRTASKARGTARTAAAKMEAEVEKVADEAKATTKKAAGRAKAAAKRTKATTQDTTA